MPAAPTRAGWESFLAAFPDAHLLQTAAWGDLKARFGWAPARLAAGAAGAQVLFRRLAPGLTLGYIPRGPVGDWLPALLPDLDALCRARRVFALKLEPDLDDEPQAAAALAAAGLRPSAHTVQPRRTLVVDLRGDEDELLARMHPKTRYNVRLAERRGVRVCDWNDLPAFGRMMHETAQRDRFGAHTPGYYAAAYDLFRAGGACELLAAEFDGAPVAALMVFAHGRRAWYLYGASTDRARAHMPTYLLQWEAMRWARARGCSEYDLWGVPDHEREALEAGFTTRADGLWGVYRFKRGFGGALRRTVGAWDRVYSPAAYTVYRLAAARRSGAD